MTTLEKLISELCPNGVVYSELRNIAEITIGEFVHKSKQVPNGPYPVYNGGTTYTGFYDEWNRQGNQIIISARGNAGFVNRVYTKFWSGNSCYTVTVDARKADWNYVYYAVKNSEKTLQNIQQKGGIPAVSKKQVENLRIPLPPLPVQQEIVRILDSFTKLTAELTAELTARRKQYEHYRDELLTFGDDVPKILLCELFNTRNGYTPSKAKADLWNNGTIPWFRMEDIRENGRILNQALQSVSSQAVKGKPFPKNSIIVATSATIGEHALITVESLANQRFTYLMIKDKYKEKVDIKFLFYYCFTLDKYCLSCLNQGSFPSVDMKKFNNYLFSLPSIEKQNQIVKQLERFDALCNDLTSGLPAEIAARQKQYEYYRDKLLTFKEL